MAAAGYRPCRYIVLRLTDRRVKAFVASGGVPDALARLEEVRNEFGPLKEAFLVGCEAAGGRVSVFVEDLLGGQRREHMARAESRNPLPLLYPPAGLGAPVAGIEISGWHPRAFVPGIVARIEIQAAPSR